MWAQCEATVGIVSGRTGNNIAVNVRILSIETRLAIGGPYFNCRNCAYIDVYVTFPDWINLKMPWAADLTMEVGNNSEKID